MDFNSGIIDLQKMKWMGKGEREHKKTSTTSSMVVAHQDMCLEEDNNKTCA